MQLTNRPSPGNINTPFGPRPKPTPRSPAIHYGQDYGWGNGEQIYAARAGRVKSYEFSGAYGKRLVIDHGDNTETWYCHTDSATVAVGAEVKGGQQIAWQGATGNVVGKHLHFEVRINGVAVDPEPYFSATSTAGNGHTPLEDDMAEEASVQEGIRISNLVWQQGNVILGELAGIRAAQADDATEASVQEAVRVSNETWKLTGQVLSKPSTAIDTAKLIAALKTAGVNVGIDAAALVKLIDASLKDDFGKIPAAVVAGIKSAL
jgi:murein DD-endopeptidase MepM/ murein hydrolase activator NlpD